MKEIGKKGNLMAQEAIDGLIKAIMLVSSRMDSSMAQANTLQKMVEYLKVYGRTEREMD